MDLKEKTDEYISRCKVMQLATVSNGQPSLCTVNYVYEKGSFYWMSLRSTKHSKQLVSDRKTAVAVLENPDVKRCVHIEGEAFELAGEEAKAAHEIYGSRFGSKPERLEEALSGDSAKRAYYVFKPKLFVFFDESNLPENPRQELNIDKPRTTLEEAKLFTDGGSRGNPGPSAIAFVICKMDNTVVDKSGEYIGDTTNNQAEYQALKMGLKRAQELGIKKLIVHMDSELVIKQINGLYKIKNAELMPHYNEIKELAGQFQQVTFQHVPRALNAQADKEVNRILDEQK